MATPMTARTVLRLLRAEGLTVREVGNWAHHNRDQQGIFGPVHGVMLHHTATRGTARTVRLCYDGRDDLPGPLCHGVIDKTGVVHLVGWGRANHAGLGDPAVLRAVIGQHRLPLDTHASYDGNRHFYGFECVNLGTGKDPWPPRQVQAMARACAAVLRWHGWNERSVIGHLEWQPGKPDPRGVCMDAVRAAVRQRLHPATPSHASQAAG